MYTIHCTKKNFKNQHLVSVLSRTGGCQLTEGYLESTTSHSYFLAYCVQCTQQTPQNRTLKNQHFLAVLSRAGARRLTERYSEGIKCWLCSLSYCCQCLQYTPQKPTLKNQQFLPFSRVHAGFSRHRRIQGLRQANLALWSCAVSVNNRPHKKP